MGKTHNKDYDWNEVQRLKAENQKLRRQIGKLRKVVQRVDLEHYAFVQDLLNAQQKEDEGLLFKADQGNLKKKWECFDCGKGILQMIILFKAGVQHYFRKCDTCGKKTKMKKYTEHVDPGVKP